MARNRRESSGIVGNRRKKWGKVNAKIYVVHTKGIRMRLIICLYYVLICSSFALRNLFTFVMCLFIYLKELNSLCFNPPPILLIFWLFITVYFHLQHFRWYCNITNTNLWSLPFNVRLLSFAGVHRLKKLISSNC